MYSKFPNYQRNYARWNKNDARAVDSEQLKTDREFLKSIYDKAFETEERKNYLNYLKKEGLD